MEDDNSEASAAIDATVDASANVEAEPASGPTASSTEAGDDNSGSDVAVATSWSYDAASLARPLGDWEVSRDHLVFVNIAGYDTAKRSVLHVLEPPSAAKKYGGVLLTAVGNTVQLLTLAPLSSPSSTESTDTPSKPSTILSRRFVFGTSGSGVGSLAVHPSRGFFAVGEKGIKPRIVIYSYPEPIRAVRVLKNGTERAYTSVCFSGKDEHGQGGDKLASVGAAPDFLLTVWDWKREATILRCKAFGQEVFRVQFAPADSGFLTTSGVGHIRMWKMAATFTGLKLQGDIGKFGKSELSDVDAFCVLPDKKVLSGTERGVLLLWEGNFIKCEIFTSRRHIPHAGAVRVVDLDHERSQIITAGADGFVRFWSYESIDAADVPPDDSVALIPMKRQVLVAPHMDIRAVVPLRDGDSTESDGPQRFLIQDAAGGVHLLTLLDGENHAVDLDFLANDTGRATGVACSPYEHLAATCGADGSVRAWDYVSQRCLMAASPVAASSGMTSASPSTKNLNAAGNSAGNGKSGSVAAATAICWVPDTAALLPVAQAGGDPPPDAQAHSRQVVVGYDDGLVRVFMADVPRRTLVRTNVFKPHSARVTCVAFSSATSNSVELATGSADATFFLFRVAPNARSSKFAKYPPEYVPLGFQRTPDALRAISWRPDGAAVLTTLISGRVIEYLLPADGLGVSASDADGNAGERETFELSLASREWAAPIERRRFMSSRELAVLDSVNPIGNPLVDDAVRHEFHVQVKADTPGAYAAMYSTPSTGSSSQHDTIWLSCAMPTPTIEDQQQEPSHNGALFVVQFGKPAPLLECAMGESHLDDGTTTATALGDAKIVTLARSSSSKFLLCGLSNGKFQLRSASHPVAFLTGEFHDASSDGSANAPGLRLALSFDDSFVVAVGGDGNLSVSRLHADKLADTARRLADASSSLRAQAAIVADQARDKPVAINQKALPDAQSAEADGDASASAAAASSNNELGAMPAFQAAKAFASFIESRLVGSADAPSVAKDSEAFNGVVQLAIDANSALGLAPVASSVVSADGDAASASAGLPPSVIETPDLESPGEAYTIEDAKRKSEADARARAAMSKQNQTRAVLKQMRQQLKLLQERDASLPPESRVDADEWEVDLDYGEILAARGDAACEEVRKELAFAVENEELLLLKLREAFVGPLAVELVTVHAFASAVSVQSFRTLKMSPALQKRLAEIHAATKNTTSSEQIGARSGSVTGLARRLSSSAIDVSGAAAAAGNAAPLSPEHTQSKKLSVLRKPSVLHIMTEKDLALDGDFPLKEEERKLLGRSMTTVGGFATSNNSSSNGGRLANATAPPGAPVTLSQPHEATNASSGASVHGFEARKRLRADRKARLAQWVASKPGEDADDPRDLVAIAFAQRNMGDYKLKTAADYVVPEEQRVNAAKKFQQLALLEESLYTSRLRFNAKILELRELKVRLVDSLAGDNARLEELYAALCSSAPKPAANLLRVDLSEWPEQRERVTDADLQLYMREKKVLPHTAASVLDTPRGSNALTAFLGGQESGDMEDANHVTLRHLQIPIRHSDSSPALTAKASKPASRGADVDDAAVREYLMKAEICALKRRRASEVAAFDETVALLRCEKMRLDVVFKAIELRLYTLHSELVLLEQFESKENLLSAKLERTKAEKAQIVADLSDVQEQTTTKKKEQEEWAQQEKAVHAEFVALVNGAAAGSSGAPHPSFAALQKVFKRRIKRPKKRNAGGNNGKDGAGGGGNGGDSPDGSGNGGGKNVENDHDDDEDDDEDEDDYDDDDDDDNDDDDDDDDDEEDMCPPGCDLGLYEKVLALREKRVNVDEAINDLTKALDELKKSLDRQSAKQRQVDKELAATEQETQVFQSEKQRRFNELDVVVALSSRQLRCLVLSLDGWSVPEQASDCLVFSTRAFAALTERVESLQRENRSLRQQFRDLHRQQSVLAKEKRAQQETIAQVAQRCDQLQLLKFGRIVDIDVLDKASDTSALRELQDKVRLKEVEAERELMASRQDEHELQRELLRATEDNTALLSQMAALSARQLALECELNESGAAAARGLQDDVATQQQLEQEMRERNKLVKLVKLQARELEALKQEIGLLRGKDGKVYAPRA